MQFFRGKTSLYSKNSETRREKVNNAREFVIASQWAKQTKFLKIIAIIFCAGFLFLGLTSFASAATYYVATPANGGDNGNNGSQASPWATLTYAQTTATTGDTINVMTGTYVENSGSNKMSFSKGITWVGKAANWTDNGNVTVQNLTAAKYFTVSSTSAVSFSNFIFDNQDGYESFRGFNADSGHGAIIFNNCSFININATAGTSGSGAIWFNAGGDITFNNSSIVRANNASANLFYTLSKITFNSSAIDITGGAVVAAVSTSNVATLNLVDTSITATNTSSLFYQSASYSSPFSMTGGSITQTGGSLISNWGGGDVTLDGVTITSLSINNGTFLSSGGNSDITINDCDVTFSTSYPRVFSIAGDSFSLKDSTLNITGSADMVSDNGASTNPSFIFDNNSITFFATANGALVLRDEKTGTVTATDNIFTIPSDSKSVYIFVKKPSTRQNIGDFNFNINTINFNNVISNSQGVVNIAHSNGNVTINGNTITQTDTSNTNYGTIFVIVDVPNPIITNNNITINSTNSYDAIVVSPYDVANWTGTGIATITGNTIDSKSRTGHNIFLGEDGSSGPSYDGKWSGSTVANNTIYGPAYHGDIGDYNKHDILIGHSPKSFIYNNKIIGGSLAFVIKDETGLNGSLDWNHEGGVYNNVVINPASGAILMKGPKNLDIYNNTFTANAISGSRYIVGFSECSSTYNGPGNHFFNNIIYNAGSNDNLHILSVCSQATVGFQAHDNLYYKSTGDIETQLFAFASDIDGLSNWISTLASQSPAITDNSTVDNPLFNNLTGNDVSMTSYLSPVIDVAATTDAIRTFDATGPTTGNPIYGTPDIGAYEYQPPHTMGTNKIDIGAGARVYGDGKFRDLGTTSSTTANLIITPQSGHFTTYGSAETRPAWMDITDITWNTSGTYSKQWTESSSVSGLTNTIHTVGDLKANTYYTLSIDDTASDTYLSDANGKITFTFTGHYSTHKFDINEDVTPPTNVSISSISVNSPTQLTVVANTATDDNALAIAPYWFTEISGNPGASYSTDWQTSNIFVDTGLSSEYQYTYKVKVRDVAGNISDYSAEVSKTPYVVAGGSSYTSTATTTNNVPEVTSPTVSNDESTTTTSTVTQTLTDQQRATLISQIKEQLITLITQLIRLLTQQASQMAQ